MLVAVSRSCQLDVKGASLLRDGRRLRVERKVFQLLVYLAAHPGRLIAREELLREVWNARALSDSPLANTIAKPRRERPTSQDEIPQPERRKVRIRFLQWKSGGREKHRVGLVRSRKHNLRARDRRVRPGLDALVRRGRLPAERA